MSSIKLDLGCGPTKRPGFIGIDKYDFGQAIIRDIEKGLPFSDDTVDEIYSSHFIEHITDWIFVFNEMWRVCKNDAKIVLRYPTVKKGGAFHPLHKTVYTILFFKQITTYDERSKATQELEREGFVARFKLINVETDGHGDQVVTLQCIK